MLIELIRTRLLHSTHLGLLLHPQNHPAHPPRASSPPGAASGRAMRMVKLRPGLHHLRPNRIVEYDHTDTLEPAQQKVLAENRDLITSSARLKHHRAPKQQYT